MGNCLTTGREPYNRGGPDEAGMDVQPPMTSPQIESTGSSNADPVQQQQPLEQPAVTGNAAATASPSARDHEHPFFVLRRTEDVSSVYELAEELGRGQFGVVRVAVDKRSRQRYAVKSISKRRTEAPNTKFCKDVRNEVEIMFHLGGHANIVQLYEVYEDADAIHLVLELCTGGDWFDRLIQNGTYSEQQAAETARALLETLSYCHSLGVVHRDIKPENMIYSDRSGGATIKLADFGLSALVPKAALEAPDCKAKGLGGPLQEGVGSSFYVAPEILKGRGYGKECDIWSLGVVLFIALGGYPPFDGTNDDEIFEATMYQPLKFDSPTWDLISDGAKDILLKMLCKDPRRRATIVELLAHPWLKAMGSPASSGHRLGPVPDTVVARLRNFAAMNRFKKEARRVLATLLPEEEVVGLRNLFAEMDKDGDGVLTLAELHEALKAKGVRIPDAQAKELLRCADLNSDGVVDYEEFIGATVHQMRLDKDELLYRAFRVFDKDGSGFITEQEMREALTPVTGGQVDIESILQDIDTDRDGRVNYEEFCNCMRVRADDGGLAALISVQTLSRPRLAFNTSGTVSRPRSRATSLTTSQRASRGRSLGRDGSSRAELPKRKQAEVGNRSAAVRFLGDDETYPSRNAHRSARDSSGGGDRSSSRFHLQRSTAAVAASPTRSRTVGSSGGGGRPGWGGGDALSDMLSHLSSGSGSTTGIGGSPNRKKKSGLHVRRLASSKSQSCQTEDPYTPVNETDNSRGGASSSGQGRDSSFAGSVFPPIQLPNSILSRPGSFASKSRRRDSRLQVQLPKDDNADDSSSPRDQAGGGRSRPASATHSVVSHLSSSASPSRLRRGSTSRHASACGSARSSPARSAAGSRQHSHAGSCASVGPRVVSMSSRSGFKGPEVAEECGLHSPLSREASKHSMSRMAMAAGLPSPHPSLVAAARV